MKAAFLKPDGPRRTVSLDIFEKAPRLQPKRPRRGREGRDESFGLLEVLAAVPWKSDLVGRGISHLKP